MTKPDANRPEVVDAVLQTLTSLDPTAVHDQMLQLGVTPQEKAAAEGLFLQHIMERHAAAPRELEAWYIFIAAGLNAKKKQSWRDLFDNLNDGQIARLRELYDVLEPGARREFDRRYGRPDL